MLELAGLKALVLIGVMKRSRPARAITHAILASNTRNNCVNNMVAF